MCDQLPELHGDARAALLAEMALLALLAETALLALLAQLCRAAAAQPRPRGCTLPSSAGGDGAGARPEMEPWPHVVAGLCWTGTNESSMCQHACGGM